MGKIDDTILNNKIIRENLAKLEKMIDYRDDSTYDKMIDKIQKSKYYIQYIDTMYLDSYLSLNYKNKTSIITQEEKKFFNKLVPVILQDASLYVFFQNDIEFRRGLIEESSKFRKYNILARSKMFYMLNDVDRGILSNLKNKLYSEINEYNITIFDIENYIKSNLKSTNAKEEIINYIEFIYFKNKSKYNEIRYQIRKENGTLIDLSNEDMLSRDEIQSYIISIGRKPERSAKVFSIVKK